MEIVIILFVVGIMISGILPLFLNVITANKSAAYYSTAYKRADSIIEETRAKPFEEIISINSFEITELPNGVGQIEITEEPGGTATNRLKLVELTINWNFKSPQEIKISTYIADGGIGR
jgi:hypothetical protein